jgi:tetratricopeptide (TPR) repeat protein
LATEAMRVDAYALSGVRETWRAILQHPEQSFSYFALAKAYQGWPVINRELREIQLARAHNQALSRLTVEELEYLGLQQLVNETYYYLFNRYLYNPGAPYFDVAGECLAQLLKTFKKYPPRVAEIPPDQVDQAEEGLRKQLARIQDEELPKRRQRFVLESVKRPVIEQASLAIRLGLLREAVKVLEDNASKLDDDAFFLLIQFYIMLGRGEEALSALKQPPPSVPDSDPQRERERLQRVQKFQHFRIRALISVGEFAEAGAALDESYPASKQNLDALPVRMALARAAAGLLMSDPTGTNPLVRGTTTTLLGRSDLFLIQNMMADMTEFHAMRGMLALEEGDTATALKHLSEAVEPQGSPPIYFPGRADALRFVEILKQQAQKK